MQVAHACPAVGGEEWPARARACYLHLVLRSKAAPSRQPHVHGAHFRREINLIPKCTVLQLVKKKGNA